MGFVGMAGPGYVSVAMSCVPLLFCGVGRAGHPVSDVDVSRYVRVEAYLLMVRFLGCDWCRYCARVILCVATD